MIPIRVVLAKVGLDGHDRGIKVVARALRDAGLGHVGVLIGGIIPEADIPKLLEMGVSHVFGPGTALPDIVAFLRARSGADHA